MVGADPVRSPDRNVTVSMALSPKKNNGRSIEEAFRNANAVVDKFYQTWKETFNKCGGAVNEDAVRGAENLLELGRSLNNDLSSALHPAFLALPKAVPHANIMRNPSVMSLYEDKSKLERQEIKMNNNGLECEFVWH